ncbi:MAG: tyrosine--tRNA ligase [Rhodospirillales bacterium]|nr:tyrosine--tRNA ligase [Alphaproteobacteria bacterium]MCB1840722.1 tyrosine--tRNA ligase [Alphaproteobacteria bacterium]MCB9977831.1 tyrosine--tRNA ligase [Rhodospirillales bacterium]
MSSYKSDFLNILTERGFIHQCSDFEGLDLKLSTGSQTGYIGFDATADSLHAGSLVQIMMLYWFQKTGHKPITLMGGGTTKIGDPSGKDESRKMLNDATIAGNIKGITWILSVFLKFGYGRNDAKLLNNSDWLENLNYIDFLREYGPHFTINRMMTFDSVKNRLEREQPLTFLEFNYMILQAYDFLELYRRYGVVLQMGGSDQWGNIINGVELSRRKDGAQIFGLTTPLLTTSSGGKMGKTAEGTVWLDEKKLPSYDYYQFWRNTEDADVGRFLKLFTTLPLDEIARLEQLQGQEINEAKKVLAFEATRMCRGEHAAVQAQNTAVEVFEKGSVGADLPFVTIEIDRLKRGASVVDLLVETGLSTSKGEARRLIQGGGARVNDVPVGAVEQTVSISDLSREGIIKISSGKKNHALVKIPA